jgi:hypothetical protein
MSPLLSHRDQKPARAAYLSKMVPITYVFFHYMVSLPVCVKAEIGEGGSEKRDYRTLWQVGGIVHMDLFDRGGQKRKH